MRSYDESKQIELISLLRQSHDEVVFLRRERDRLSPYERVLSIMERAMFGPQQGRGEAEDVVWRIQKALDLLIKERDEARPKSDETIRSAM